MRVIWFITTMLAFATTASIRNDVENIRYDNYKVFKLIVKDRAQLKIIENLANIWEKFNIWKDYDEASKEVHIMVHPQEIENFEKLLKLNGIQSELMINNVQELIDAENVNVKSSLADSKDFGWTRYYDLHEIENWLDGILAAYPNVTEGFEVGKSYENRTIRGIKISHKPGNPGIFIESNIHAREWVTSATATWFINQLLTSQEPAVRNLAESYDWFIVPIFNIDGFAYTHEKDRMWRKTRQPIETSKCIGTDANRNFDSYWMVNNGASSDPCSNLYAGSKPFSEPETAALAKYLTSIKDKFKIYLAFHSYSQFVLSPYGHTTEEEPENHKDLWDIGKAFTDAVAGLSYKTNYTHGQTSSVLYIMSGSSVDWVYNELNIKVSFTIEYRDTGHFGFVLPPVQILPNCEESMAGIIALVGKSKQLGYI